MSTAVENIEIKSNELAAERTMLAHERTLMAWVRTAVSLISFGFTIYKFFNEMDRSQEGRETILTPRIMGMILIGFGFLGLLLAQIQHSIAMKKLKVHYPGIQRSVSSVLSILILVFGLVLFLATLFRQ